MNLRLGAVVAALLGPFPAVAATGPADLARDAGEVGIVFLGDAGNGDDAQYAVGRAIGAWCGQHRCDVVAYLGDNFYPKGVRSAHDRQWQTKFEAPYADLHLPFRPILGNHDYYGRQQAQLVYRSERWWMPARFYHYEVGAGLATMIGIDTQRFSPEQAGRLQAVLADSKSPWTIVYGHFPVYSYGMHHGPAKLRAKLEPLLAGHAAFYLCGHEHDQQVIEAPDGVTYVVSGGGGAETRSVEEGPGAVYTREGHGFGYLSLNATSATLRMLDENGVVLFEKVYVK